MYGKILLCSILVWAIAAVAGSKTSSSSCCPHKKHTQEKKQDASTHTAQRTCPVMGGDINKDIYADHDGKRVYFCCKECIAEFKKNPQAYLDTLEKRGEMPHILSGRTPQKTCPVMGGAIDTSVYVDHEGERVYFCCPQCKKTFRNDPQTYLDKLSKMGEAPESL